MCAFSCRNTSYFSTREFLARGSLNMLCMGICSGICIDYIAIPITPQSLGILNRVRQSFNQPILPTKKFSHFWNGFTKYLLVVLDIDRFLVLFMIQKLLELFCEFVETLCCVVYQTNCIMVQLLAEYEQVV